MFGRPKQNTASTASVPSPIGGWNARDSLANMSPTDAVQLVNLFPTPTDVTLRKGYTKTSTGIDGKVNTLMNYSDVTLPAGYNLFAAAGDTIYDAKPDPAEVVFTGITSDKFQFVNLTNQAGHFLVACNGVDPTMVYDGSNWFYLATTTTAQTITTITRGGTGNLTATLTTDVPHGLVDGNRVTISGAVSNEYNGVYVINVTGLNTFTYTMATAPAANASVVGIYTVLGITRTVTGETISSITFASTLATLTTATAHGLSTGDRVTITGATANNYNGTYVITVTSTTTFTYTMVSAPAANATVVGTYNVLTVDSSTFINVNLFKNRLYFTEKDQLTCWYLDVNAIAGEASPLYFGGIARNGGFLQAMGTWTLDAGQGADDYAVFVTSMGEIIVYNGTDPDVAETWLLKGVWQLGQTFSRRCFFKWAGDLLLLTQDGLVPLAASLQSSRLDPRINLTDKIYYAVSQAATQFYDLFGWQINYYASENMLILSIPTTVGMEQYVMHTITKSWARFTNIEAYCWEVSGDADMHFGGDGYVGKFYDTFADDGNNINATAQQAFSYFDSPGQLKRFTLIRPIIQTSNGLPSVLVGIRTDFDTSPLVNQIAFNPNTESVGVWDTGIWDDCTWYGGLITTKIWQGVTGIGFTGSVNMNVASNGIEFHWASTDYVMERGGVV
jgi:hypothetical protein